MLGSTNAFEYWIPHSFYVFQRPLLELLRLLCRLRVIPFHVQVLGINDFTQLVIFVGPCFIWSEFQEILLCSPKVYCSSCLYRADIIGIISITSWIDFHHQVIDASRCLRIWCLHMFIFSDPQYFISGVAQNRLDVGCDRGMGQS